MGTGSVYAQNTGTGTPSLIERIASRFGLNQSDVQSVFDNYRNERKTQMETGYKNYLNDLVRKGTITETQKEAIIAKRKELEAERTANREDWKTMTPEQRQQAMQQKHVSLETWAKDNGIDLSLLFGMGGRGFHMIHHW